MLFEVHAHTSETSRCARVPAREVIKKYYEAGYDGVVITDHYSFRFFETIDEMSHSDAIDLFLQGYRQAKSEGDKLGITVLMAVECTFTDHQNDFLIYGLTEEFLKTAPRLSDLSLNEFLEIKPVSALIYQAHPFRNMMIITSPSKLFGIEVYNGHSGHDSRNNIALEWANMYNLHKISGSDFHYEEHIPTGGLIFDEQITNMEEFCDALRNDRYKLKTAQ